MLGLVDQSAARAPPARVLPAGLCPGARDARTEPKSWVGIGPNGPIGPIGEKRAAHARARVAQAKAKILVVTDVEREDIDFISKTLGCLPISHVDHMRPAKLGHAALVEELSVRAGSPRCATVLHGAGSGFSELEEHAGLHAE